MNKFTFKSVILDLDGVVTKTALVHAEAWKLMFEEYLHVREHRDHEPFKAFTHEGDYLPYVDGKPRYNGVKSFLESRGINIPFGDPSDPPGKETVCGLGNKKNISFTTVLKKNGAEVYPSTIELIKELKSSGVRIGVASSSKNCRLILESAGIADLFETRVDGEVSPKLGLKGKPEGDIFVTAARNLGTDPSESIVIEDATSGVQAGRNGGFRFVLGLARQNNEEQLLMNGADIVVKDISEIDSGTIEAWFLKTPKPLFPRWDMVEKKAKKGSVLINPYYNRTAKEALFNGRKLIFFLDYDGTLTPIVEKPELAVLAEDMRAVVEKLAEKHTVAIVSGRMRDNVEDLVKIPGIFYAGSHGFDIKGPGFSMVHPKAQEIIPVVDTIIKQLREECGGIPGALIEGKKFSAAVHYRLVDEGKYLSKIKNIINTVVKNNKTLRLMSGKKVFEILPNIVWNKGMAIRWIMDAFKIAWDNASVVYIGDDVTDEYAFRVIVTRGTAILVSDKPKPSSADFLLSSPSDVQKLFEKIIAL